MCNKLVYLFVFVSMMFLMFTFASALDMPVREWSISQDRCTRVFYEEKWCDCTIIKTKNIKKYNTRYVK